MYSSCHLGKHGPGQQVPTNEFRKMRWMEGLWKESGDSVAAFHLWRFLTDSSMQEISWIKGKNDSSLTGKMTIEKDEEEGILLEYEKTGQNEGSPLGFRMTVNRNGEHVFESQSHTFPQRIIFLLKPDGSLYYRTEGILSGENHFNEVTMNKIR